MRSCYWLGAVGILYCGVSALGIGWGLPSRDIDKYLFGADEVWSGERIYRLAGGQEKFSPEGGRGRGADVDVDPLTRGGVEPIPLTATEEEVARIYLRYRLYTHQPDEMITMMALAGMRPGKLELDPKLYQYGGLFLYPVGVLIKLCGMVGWIDVRGDVVFYLDHPDEFGKFYVVARAYAAAWGLVGVLVVFSIARRMVRGRLSAPSLPAFGKGGPSSDVLADGAGVVAAILFTVMPVVVCMSHEGKPHLPGAVLMLMAVLLAMRCVGKRVRTVAGQERAFSVVPVAGRCHAQSVSAADWWWMCVCCGAALGMVLSSWPIFVLIPLVAWITKTPPRPLLGRGGRRSPGDEVSTEKGRLRGVKSAAEADDVRAVHRTVLYAAGGESESGAGRGDGVSFPGAEKVPAGRRAVARRWDWAFRAVMGVAVGAAVYLITNPYIVINLLTHRAVLASNFGNTLAMYEVSRVVEGFLRVVDLTAEGATPAVLALGVVALMISLRRRRAEVMVLIVPAGACFVQFVLIGAGKPAEYGRFGIFVNAALAIGAACVAAIATSRFNRAWRVLGAAAAVVLIVGSGWNGWGYLSGFIADAEDRNSRMALASSLSEWAARPPETGRAMREIGTFAEPAPYCFPPVDFSAVDVRLIPLPDRGAVLLGPEAMTVAPLETSRTPISWANKDFFDSRNGSFVQRAAIPLGR